MEEALADIVVKSINVVTNMEFDCEASWVRSLEEIRPTQIVDQWLDWLTNTSSGDESPNIDWLVELLLGTKKHDTRIDPGIKPWSHIVKTLRGIFKNICNLKVSLVFFPYRWADGVKLFSGNRNV